MGPAHWWSVWLALLSDETVAKSLHVLACIQWSPRDAVGQAREVTDAVRWSSPSAASCAEGGVIITRAGRFAQYGLNYTRAVGMGFAVSGKPSCVDQLPLCCVEIPGVLGF